MQSSLFTNLDICNRVAYFLSMIIVEHPHSPIRDIILSGASVCFTLDEAITILLEKYPDDDLTQTVLLDIRASIDIDAQDDA